MWIIRDLGSYLTCCASAAPLTITTWEKNHVASMSRGVSGNVWEALKTNGNFANRKARVSVGNAL